MEISLDTTQNLNPHALKGQPVLRREEIKRDSTLTSAAPQSSEPSVCQGVFNFTDYTTLKAQILDLIDIRSKNSFDSDAAERYAEIIKELSPAVKKEIEAIWFQFFAYLGTPSYERVKAGNKGYDAYEKLAEEFDKYVKENPDAINAWIAENKADYHLAVMQDDLNQLYTEHKGDVWHIAILAAFALRLDNRKNSVIAANLVELAEFKAPLSDDNNDSKEVAPSYYERFVNFIMDILNYIFCDFFKPVKIDEVIDYVQVRKQIEEIIAWRSRTWFSPENVKKYAELFSALSPSVKKEIEEIALQFLASSYVIEYTTREYSPRGAISVAGKFNKLMADTGDKTKVECYIKNNKANLLKEVTAACDNHESFIGHVIFNAYFSILEAKKGQT